MITKNTINKIVNPYDVECVSVKRNMQGYDVILDHNIYWKEQMKFEKEIMALKEPITDIIYKDIA